MARYLKIISWTCLISGLIIIGLMLGTLIIWRKNQPQSLANKIPALTVIPPTTESQFTSNSPIVGLIKNMNGDTLWVSRFGQDYEIKIDPKTIITKTATPIPIAPNSTAKKTTPTKTPVKANYLKAGQKVKITPQIISSSQPIILATALEIWE